MGLVIRTIGLARAEATVTTRQHGLQHEALERVCVGAISLAEAQLEVTIDLERAKSGAHDAAFKRNRRSTASFRRCPGLELGMHENTHGAIDTPGMRQAGPTAHEGVEQWATVLKSTRLTYAVRRKLTRCAGPGLLQHAFATRCKVR